jgi:hypothetical protein
MRTAVERLQAKLWENNMLTNDDLKLFKEAKEMEKEQRKNDFRAGWNGNKHKDWNCEFYLQVHLTNQFKQQEQ